MPDNVVRIGDPKGSRSDVYIQKAATRTDKDAKVILDDVPGLDAVFQEIGVAHDIVGDVVLHEKIVYGMDGDGTVEGVVYTTPAHVRS